jgi:TDG/mug DNA glycosylase family protein
VAAPAVPDVIAPELDVLFVGLNPDPISGRVRHHFANPVNAFWRLLHESGFTPRRFAPEEEACLLPLGIGVTNLVMRVTRGVSDLSAEDLDRGRRALERKLARWRPHAVVFVGVTAWRAFTRDRGPIECGEAPSRRGVRVFVLPNPSGRNAHYPPARMRRLWSAVARALGRGRSSRRRRARSRALGAPRRQRTS